MYPFVLELMTKFIMIQNQQREVMSTVAAGRAITDDDILEMMMNHTSSHSPLATTTTSTTSSVVQAHQAFLNNSLSLLIMSLIWKMTMSTMYVPCVICAPQIKLGKNIHIIVMPYNRKIKYCMCMCVCTHFIKQLKICI